MMDSATRPFPAAIRVNDGTTGRPGEIPIGRPVTTYSCGPALTAPPHVAQLRHYVAVDTIHRAVELFGGTARGAILITDAVRDAERDFGTRGAAERAVEQNSLRFVADLDWLHIGRPKHLLRMSHYIPRIVETIDWMIGHGFAYVTRSGVYADSSRLPSTATYANPRAKADLAGADRRLRADFALWRAASDADLFSFESPWGVGIPGMNVPCVAVCLDLFGAELTLHTGVEHHRALHHANERALMAARFGSKHEWPDAWMHVGFVQVGGQNLTRRRRLSSDDLRSLGVGPNALRMLFLQSHYSNRLSLDSTSLLAAESAWRRLHGRIERLTLPRAAAVPDMATARKAVAEDQAAIRELDRLIQLISNDLRTASILALVQEWVRRQPVSAEALTILLGIAGEFLGLPLIVVDR